MANATKNSDSIPPRRLALPRKRRWRTLLVVFALFCAATVTAWISREEIAGNIIEAELERLGIPATYEIVSITPQKQLLRNLIVGDPDRPDLAVEEIVVNLDYGWAGPAAGKIEIVRPRLYGTYRDGQFSLGALDPAIFAESDEPAGLPALDIVLRDGRALFETDFGDFGVKLSGNGMLNDGFTGELAIVGPGVGTGNCFARTATAFGQLTTTGGVPAANVATFNGPIRLGGIACAGSTLEGADANVDVALTSDFAGLAGSITLVADQLSFAGNSSDTIAGDIELGWGKSGLNVSHDITAKRVTTNYGSISELRADGSLRSDAEFARSDWTADISGNGVSFRGNLESVLEDASDGAEGTFVSSLLNKFQRNFKVAASNADLRSSIVARQNGSEMSVVIPEGRLTSASGEALIAVSRVSWATNNSGSQLRGNFLTGGEGLPRINGRMEQVPTGGLMLRMTMAEYAAGSDRIALPRLQVAQGRSGNFEFNGIVKAGGALPGGKVTALELPIEGQWSTGGELSLGRRCSRVRFDALAIYDLSLEGQSLALCPEHGPMVRYGDSLQISAKTRDLELVGQLAGSPTAISTKAVSFSYPGSFELNELAATIGEDGSAMRLRAEVLRGDGEGLSGTFSGADASLDFVPLDLASMAGRWAYRDDTLQIDESTFVLSERIEGEARFEPLLARDATLSLFDGDIRAQAALTHPGSQRLITQVDVDHNLGTGQGQATLAVPSVVFDDQLRPEDISYLAKGVIAFADGAVSGEGMVRWTEDTIVSGGTFGTERLDLAATFGPIDGLRGSIEFTDLINLTTAPDQVIEIGSINPGIEVLGGRVVFSMTNGELISVKDARWPFMGGELILSPVDIRYGEQGEQLYVFEIVGLDAATFIAQMELTNLGADGTFDGTVPILFDDQGNGTIGTGLLISRPPGGNVSYIGELTYEDMGAITNFAFQSLRSLDYKQMSIGLDGSLAGEIVTSFKIDGVRQGEGASQNLVTRQLAKLPIRFNINVRSQNFYQLATMVRSFFDPEYLGNPVDKGLLSVEEGRFAPNPSDQTPQPSLPVDQDDDRTNQDIRRDNESPVQPSESDETL